MGEITTCTDGKDLAETEKLMIYEIQGETVGTKTLRIQPGMALVPQGRGCL